MSESAETGWSAEQHASVERFRAEYGQRKFYFLIIGRTGVGKSSTVNSLFSRDVAPVGYFEATTKHIDWYEITVQGIPFVFIDTPGFTEDDLSDTDHVYLTEMRSKVSHIDCLLFVTRLDESRIAGDELRSLELLTKAFGPDVWEKAIVVFTFADVIKRERYTEVVNVRSRLIRNAIARYAGPLTSKGVPAIAVANTLDGAGIRADGSHWVGELFSKIVLRVAEDAAVPFFLALRPNLLGKAAPNHLSPQPPLTEDPARLSDPGIEFARQELQRIYEQTRAQSIYWHRFSLGAAVLGFAIFAFGIALLLSNRSTEGVITLLSSIIPSTTAGLFFAQSKQANERVDAIQGRLSETEKLDTAIKLARSIANSEAQDRVKGVIVERILRGTLSKDSDSA